MRPRQRPWSPRSCCNITSTIGNNVIISTLAASFISLDRQMSVKFAWPQISLGAFLPKISHLAQKVRPVMNDLHRIPRCELADCYDTCYATKIFWWKKGPNDNKRVMKQRTGEIVGFSAEVGHRFFSAWGRVSTCAAVCLLRPVNQFPEYPPIVNKEINELFCFFLKIKSTAVLRSFLRIGFGFMKWRRSSGKLRNALI